MTAIGFPDVVDPPHELLRLRVQTQRVRVDHASWQQHGVEVVRVGLVERQVDVEDVRLHVVVHRLHAVRLRRNDLRPRARLFQRLLRLGELNALEIVRHKNGHV